MSKAVMISIRPEWCEKIAHGGKTVEVRKTRPKLEPPFKCYIYCTKAPDVLVQVMRDGDDNYGCTYHGPPAFIKTTGRTYGWLWHRQQKVIGEFVCDGIFPLSFYASDASFFDTVPALPIPGTCLTDKEIVDYLGNGKTGYGWHISDLVIYDTPMELCDFCYPSERYCEKQLCGGCPYDEVPNEYGEFSFDCEWRRPIQRPPQSWCYVEEMKEETL